MTIHGSEPLKFAYWVPNVSGGLVISNIEQRTGWDIDYNIKLAKIAERAGFDYALSQIRFTAGYGAEFQHESVSFSHALLAATEKLKVIAALLPGPWAPALAAKQIATINHLTKGRVAVNIVSRLVPRRIRRDRPALARPRRALSPLGRIHPRAARHLDGGQLHLQRRLLPFRQLLAEAEADRAVAGDLPGRLFARGARHGIARVRLVFHQRQHARGNRQAGRRYPGQGRAKQPFRPGRRQRLRDRARHRGRGQGRARRDHRESEPGGGQRLRPRSQECRQSVAGGPGQLGEIDVRRSRPIQRRLPLKSDRHAASRSRSASWR